MDTKDDKSLPVAAKQDPSSEAALHEADARKIEELRARIEAATPDDKLPLTHSDMSV